MAVCTATRWVLVFFKTTSVIYILLTKNSACSKATTVQTIAYYTGMPKTHLIQSSEFQMMLMISEGVDFASTWCFLQKRHMRLAQGTGS